MKHKAYQIVNFKDPLSIKYFEHSQKSLKIVEDLLDVEPIQCVTPEEVDDYNHPFIDSGRKGTNRSIYEKACYLSHINLVKRLAAGEKFFILEHDVYVWPNEESLTILYTLMSNVKNYAGIFPGISNEFYTMNQEVSKIYINLSLDKNDLFGPLGAARESMRHLATKVPITVAFPIASLKNKMGVGRCADKIAFGKNCEKLPAPITQHYILSEGSTIKTRNATWKVSRKKNPNFYFTEE